VDLASIQLFPVDEHLGFCPDQTWRHFGKALRDLREITDCLPLPFA
jgi:hypothetical protein